MGWGKVARRPDLLRSADILVGRSRRFPASQSKANFDVTSEMHPSALRQTLAPRPFTDYVGRDFGKAEDRFPRKREEESPNTAGYDAA